MFFSNPALFSFHTNWKRNSCCYFGMHCFDYNSIFWRIV